MATLVQWSYGQWADPSTATFAAVPTAGNLLVAIAAQRSGTSHTAFVLTGITGWAKRLGVDHNLASTTYRTSAAIWTKVAGASEPTSVTFDDGTANSKLVAIAEFALAPGETEWTFLESAGTGYDAPTSPQTTGNTASVSGNKFFVLSVAVFKYQYIYYPTSALWTVAGDEKLTPIGNATAIRYGFGHITDTVSGVRSDVVAFDGTITAMINGILVFRVVPAGAATPVFMHHFKMMTGNN